MRRFLALIALTAAALTSTAGVASASDQWLHVSPAAHSVH